MVAKILLFFLLIVALNLYAFRGIYIIARGFDNKKHRRSIIYSFFLIDLLFIVFSIFWIIFIRTSGWPDFIKYRNYFYISGAFALIYFPKFVLIPFVLINDLKLLLGYMLKQIILPGNSLNKKIRFYYSSGFILFPALFFSLFMFFVVLHGIVIGKTNFKVNDVVVYFDDLPDSFDGFVIAQISDTHLGSFKRKTNVRKGVEMIIAHKPDLFVLTGDLINNEVEEGMLYSDLFNKLTPPYGKFSVLGNHDIGDYRRWYTIEESDPDIESLEKLHKKLGFNLLRDQHAFIHRGEDSIMIAGVDNWGLPPFRKTGELKRALFPNNDFDFIVLLSHDPTHWPEEIKGRENIRLTLSGHTHGMQLGLLIGNTRWSPSKYIYPKWQGLYEYCGQYLYVNTGFGFLGLPLRIGMPPEITLITLKRALDKS